MSMSMRLLIALLLITLAIIAGCIGKDEEKINPARPIIVVDSLGRNVSISGKPQRIVSLAPSNTEILFALGLADKIVGVTEYCNYPEAAKQKPKIGGYYTVNVERVVALKPDLVIAEMGNGREVVEALQKFEVPVVVLEAKRVEDVFNNIALAGRAAGAEKNAALLIDSLKAKVEAIRQKNGDLEGGKRPKVLYIVWHDPIWCAGRDTFADDLISLAGGRNIAINLSGYKVIDLETIVREDPDVIITSGMTAGDWGPTYEYVRGEPRLSQVQALKNNRVYAVDSDIVSRAGPRVVEALELFARAMR